MNQTSLQDFDKRIIFDCREFGKQYGLFCCDEVVADKVKKLNEVKRDGRKSNHC